jgi:transcriptional antiterminator NusG
MMSDSQRRTESRPTAESRVSGEFRIPNPKSRVPESRISNPESRAEQWFAVWTRSRHEQVVREQLERKRIDAFLPTITRWSRWKDRKKKVDWPLFPGYCFARFNGDDTLPILKCTGVVSIVSFEGKPAAIPEYELDSIRVLVTSELQFDPCPMIHEGMMVEVVHGPLKGVVGRLMRKDAPKARLVLSVDLIGQAVSVEVDAADVKAY